MRVPPVPRYWLHERLTSRPVLASTYCTLRNKFRGKLANRDSDLVVEGFPRSANTYAKAVILAANPELRIASHLHSAYSVRRAARLGLPTLVVIREPVGAVSSLLVRERGLNVGTALRCYARFYEGIVPVRDSFIVADFGHVTRRMPHVVAALNARFRTAFQVPPDGEDATERVMSMVEQMERVFAAGSLNELAVARPSAERKEALQKMTTIVRRPRYRSLLKRCQVLYSIIYGDGDDIAAHSHAWHGDL